MTSPPARLPLDEPFAAGWRADPDDARMERWWTGERWGEERRFAPQAHLEERMPARPPDSDTVEAHALGVSPFWFALVPFLPFTAWGYRYRLIEPLMPGGVALILFAIAVVVLIALVVRDGRALRSRGLAAPSPLWAVLGPLVYLTVRHRLHGGSDLLLFALVLLVSLVLGMVVVFRAGLAAFTLFGVMG